MSLHNFQFSSVNIVSIFRSKKMNDEEIASHQNRRSFLLSLYHFFLQYSFHILKLGGKRTLLLERHSRQRGSHSSSSSLRIFFFTLFGFRIKRTNYLTSKRITFQDSPIPLLFSLHPNRCFQQSPWSSDHQITTNTDPGISKC